MRNVIAWIRGPLVVAVGSAVLVACSPVMPTPPQSAGIPSGISVPSCPPNAGCGEGFLLDGAFYGPVCVRVHEETVEPQALATSTTQYAEVRRIVGLSSDFLAVRGDIPCGPTDPDDWWLAQGDASPSELDAARPRLGEVTFTP